MNDKIKPRIVRNVAYCDTHCPSYEYPDGEPICMALGDSDLDDVITPNTGPCLPHARALVAEIARLQGELRKARDGEKNLRNYQLGLMWDGKKQWDAETDRLCGDAAAEKGAEHGPNA